MSEQPPQPPPPPPPPAPGPAGGQPVPGVPRPGELLDRFLARLIDSVLLGIVFGVLQAIFVGIFIAGSTSAGEYVLAWLFISVINVVVTLGYFAFLESSNGATLGKQLLKLKVVGPDGVSNPTMEQALRRNSFYALYLAFIIPFIGPVIGGLGLLAAYIYIAVTINNDTVARQGWHDKFADTRVLKIG